MSYLEKHTENENAAALLYTSEYYDAAINRYYYSSFQYMVHILKDNGIELTEEEKNSGGSHDATMKKFNEYLQSKGTKDKQKGHKIRSKYRDIKKFRRNADYEEEKNDKGCAIIVKGVYNELKTLLKSI